jgi:excisionase family DNA binding protein
MQRILPTPHPAADADARGNGPAQLPPPDDVVAPTVSLRLLLTPAEAARALSISPRTLWQRTRDQQIQAIRIGRSVRYLVADLESYIAKLREAPPPRNRGCCRE